MSGQEEEGNAESISLAYADDGMGERVGGGGEGFLFFSIFLFSPLFHFFPRLI